MDTATAQMETGPTPMQLGQGLGARLIGATETNWYPPGPWQKCVR